MRARWSDGLALAGYALLAAGLTFPLVARFSTAIPGTGDTWLFYWNIWWTKVAVLDRVASPFQSTMVRFPYGADLHFHTLNLLQNLLTLPIAAWNLAAAYNVVVVGGLTLGGFATYLLCLDILTSGGHDADRSHHLAAFVGGALFAFSSYHYVHLRGHLDMVSSQWLPLATLFLLKTLRDQHWSNPILCGVFYGATALTSEYYLLALILFALVAVLHSMTTGSSARGWARRIVMAVAVAFAIGAPLLVPMLLHPAGAMVADAAYDVDRFSVDALAFVVPSRLHPLWGHLVAPVYQLIERHGSGIESIAYLGLVPLGLTIVSLRRGARDRGLWSAGLVLFALLAMGPVMHVAGHAMNGWQSAWMPYRWLVALPFRNIPRVPARLVVMAMLSVAVLASQGAWHLLRQVRTPVAVAIACGLIVLHAIDSAVLPQPLSSTTLDSVPAVYNQIAADSRESAVLDVPIPDDPSQYPDRMRYQTVHQHPVYGGYLSRGLPPLAFEAIPGFAHFKNPAAAIDDIVSYEEAGVDALGLTLLNAYSAGFVVIDKTLLSVGDERRMQAAAERLFGSAQRFHEDARTVSYRVPEAIHEVAPAVWIDTGWSYLERAPSGDVEPARWRWMSDSARVGVLGSPPARVRLEFVAHAFERARRIRVTNRDLELATCVVETRETRCETAPFVTGEHPLFVTVTSMDSTDRPQSVDPRHLSVAVSSIRVLTQ